MALAKTEPAKATVWEDSSPVNMARVVGYDNANVTQSDVSACKYMVTSGGTTIIAATTLTVADVVFDALQTTATDARWTEDSTGYNFKHQLSATDIPSGGTVYDVVYRFEDSSGNHYFVPFELETKEQYFS